MALYSLNLEVRSRKRGSERARVPAPALIHRNCVLRLSSLLRLQRSPSACGRGGRRTGPLPGTRRLSVRGRRSPGLRTVQAEWRVWPMCSPAHICPWRPSLSPWREQTPPLGEHVSLYPTASWAGGLRLTDRPARTCFLIRRSRCWSLCLAGTAGRPQLGGLYGKLHKL